MTHADRLRLDSDGDGYPTDDSLEQIANWKATEADYRPLLEAIQPVWRFGDYGYWEKDWRTGIYHVSTAGWSGNEDIIRALHKADERLFWFFCFVAQRRGGHYEFRVWQEEPCWICGLLDPNNKWHSHAEVT